MLVLHGIWVYGALWLWAEDSGRPAGAAPRPGRPSRAPRPHPFACDVSLLADALSELAEPVADLARKAVEDELTLFLPSTAGGPVASPGLIGPGTGDAGQGRRPGARRPALAAWRIPALTFEPAAALRLLTVLGQPARREPVLGDQAPADQLPVDQAPGELEAGDLVPGELADAAGKLAVAGSVPYLAALARLADDLAARGRVLPQLAAEDDGYAARWRPVLTGTDAQRAAELAAAMPPLCRATSAAGEPPARLVTDALEEFSDAAARARLAGLPLWPGRGRGRPGTKVADRWLRALTNADARIGDLTPSQEADAADLGAELAAWRATAQVPAGPVRTCFRLAEPELAGQQPGDAVDRDAAGQRDGVGQRDAAGHPEDVGHAEDAGQREDTAAGQPEGAIWRVEFSLQSTDDPSLIRSAADIWAGPAGWQAAGGIRHPEEELLAGLGTAARLFPELDTELRSAAPEQVTLDTAGAFRFLSQTAPLLSGAGFGVLLPDWARKARLGLKLTARSRSSQKGAVTEPKFGLGDLVDFRYDLAVGDEALDPEELAELARLKIPLIRVRGQWVELDDRHLKAALRFLERGIAGTMSAGDAMLAGLRGEDELPVVAVEADGWLGDLLSGQADRRLAPVATPAAFTGTLRPYQERGLAWMAFLSGLGIGLILADDMGLGKTIELLSLLAHERDPGPAAVDAVAVDAAAGDTAAEGPAAGNSAAGNSAAGDAAPGEAGTSQPRPGPTLLVCPMSLAGNWQREAERFTPDLRVHVHHGPGRLTGAELTEALTAADLVITTYAIAARDAGQLSAIRWARVVCDEAQNIKNPAARQAQAVRSLPADSRIALTGTPVENRLAELWSIMEFTNPGLLGPAEKFRTAFAVPIERHGDAAAAERLKRITGPFILRRLKTDASIISDLPDKLEMKVWCNLTPEQATLYQATVTDMLARIEAAEEGIKRRGLVLATMAKLKQVCNHPAHLLGDGSRLAGRSGKLARLEEICDEVMADGEKALCFTQYAEFGSMLQPYLAARLGCPVLYLHGGTSKRQRDAMVARFDDLTEPAIFLLSLKAGGTGLNLTAANHVIHVDRWWNPAVEDQATDRAFRIGQTRDVQVRKFICVGTLEERIDTMIEEKKALADRIIGTGESWLGELSVAELRQVITLSPEAVSE
jgi:SNF2 family DNA or RNA helicase